MPRFEEASGSVSEGVDLYLHFRTRSTS
jgi:hypothetical protein